AELVAVLDVAQRSAEDQREADDLAQGLLAQHPHGYDQRDQAGDADENPAHLHRVGLEHAERDAEVVGQPEIEERQQLDHIAALHRQRVGDVALHRLVDEEQHDRRREADEAIFRELAHAAASSSATASSHRLHSAPSSVTSGRRRQQRPHLWSVVRVTVTASPCPRTTDAVMNSSARSASVKPSGTASAGTVTWASSPERTTLSRRSGSIASVTRSRSAR